MDNESISPQPPLPKPSKRVLIPTNVKISLLIFLLSSAAVLVEFPKLDKTSASPSFGLFLGVGLVMILFTSLLFAALSKLNLGFGKTALVLGLGYNAVIAIIKFVLAPQALYLSNRNTSFSDQAGSPNGSYYYIVISVSILVIYIGVFRIVYNYFRRRAAKRNSPQTDILVPKSLISLVIKTISMVIVGGGIIVVGLFIEQLFNPSLSYLAYVFGALGIPILIAVILGTFLAYKSFQAVEKQMILTGSTTLLASFFWLGVSLIVLYHIMWVIFMLTLVHIWPFNTYSPK